MKPGKKKKVVFYQKRMPQAVMVQKIKKRKERKEKKEKMSKKRLLNIQKQEIQVKHLNPRFLPFLIIVFSMKLKNLRLMKSMKNKLK